MIKIQFGWNLKFVRDVKSSTVSHMDQLAKYKILDKVQKPIAFLQNTWYGKETPEKKTHHLFLDFWRCTLHQHGDSERGWGEALWKRDSCQIWYHHHHLYHLRRVLDRSKWTSRLLTRGLARAGVMGWSWPIRWKETMIFGSSTWSSTIFMMMSSRVMQRWWWWRLIWGGLVWRWQQFSNDLDDGANGHLSTKMRIVFHL